MEEVINNTSVNTTNSTTSTSALTPQRKALILPPMILLSLLTCIANIIVMLCIYVEKSLRKANNLYVVSLAIADLLVGLLVMPAMLVYTLNGYWPLGSGVCTAWVSVDGVCCSVSLFHLCLIAHDRYQALVHPLKYKTARRKQIILIQIVVTWFVSCLLWVPAPIAFRTLEEYPEDDCYYMPNKYFVISQSVLQYYFAILLMLFFYVRCLIGLKNQFNKMQSMGTATKKTIENKPTVATVSTTEGEGSSMDTAETTASSKGEPAKKTIIPNDVSERRRRNHIRSIRTLGFIISLFLFCWLPFTLFWPISSFCADCIPLTAYEYSYWAAYINSAVNPLLYFICNKDFRTAFKTLVCRCGFCKVSPSN